MIPRGELLTALDAVKGAIAQKAFEPILTHVYISGDEVIGYDSEVGVKVKMSVNTGVEFNARFDMFHQLIKNMSADDVDISIEGRKVKIVCGKHKSTHNQITEREYPKTDLRLANEVQWQEVPAGFKEALERAILSASESEADKVLSCVLLSGSRVYAANRQSIVRCTLEGLNMPPTLLSRKGVEEIIRLGAPARMGAVGPWAVFDYTNLTFLARLREGAAEFPPCDVVFDKVGDPELTPIPDGLGTILKRLSLFVGKGGKVVVGPSMMGCEMTAGNETGNCTEYLDEQKSLPAGKAFSPHKLAEMLMYAETMAWGSPRIPIYLNGQVANFEFVLQPMAMSEGG